MRGHKRKEQRAQRGSRAQKVVVAYVIGDVDDNSLKEELETCKHFLLTVRCRMGDTVYNFAMDTRDSKLLLEKLHVVFHSLKCAAYLNVAFGFVPKNVEDGICMYFYAHEKKTLLTRFKFVATPEDKMENLQADKC